MTSRTVRRFWPLVALSLVLLTEPADAQQRVSRENEQQKSAATVLNAFRAVVAKPSQCTVRIQCGGRDVALGTIVGPDGWILTKASELKGLPSCQLHDGRRAPARIVGIHQPFDLALLKVDLTGLPSVEWRDSKGEAVGNWVAAPGPGDTPVAFGVISVATRPVTARDLPPSPRSGAYLGVVLSQEPDVGARINEVTADTPAGRSGLKVNDVILSLAGEPVQDSDSLIDTMQRHKPGEEVLLRVKRGTQELELKLTLGRRPGAGGRGGRGGGDFQNRMSGPLSQHRNGFPVILQHDAVLRPNDCGGPLVDLDGKVIGINVARAGRTETYAAPTEAVLPLLYDLMSGKLAPKPDTTPLSPEEKVTRAQAVLEQADAEKAAAEKKLLAARKALERAQAEAKDAEKKD